MNEYASGHSEFIPQGEADARVRLDALRASLPGSFDRTTFLRGWYALFWLYPGLHPDGFDENWEDEFEVYRPLAAEAFRRADSGELTDEELYPVEAQQARLRLEREAFSRGEGAPLIPGDELVVLLGPDGRYVGRNEADEISWVDDISNAHKYYRKLDAVDAQIRDVKRLLGIDWTIVTLHWK